MQRLVFFDLDGTLIDDPSSEKSYIFWLITRRHIGLRQIIKALKFLAKWIGKLKYIAFVRNKAYLHGLPIKQTVQQAQQFTKKKLLSRLRQRIIARLKQHKADGDVVILLTGAPKFIADVFAQKLGILDVRATECSSHDDCFDELPPLQHPFGQEKVTVAQKVCAEYQADIHDSVAYGNSIHDAALLRKVGKAIAVTPDRKLRRVAQQEGWEIVD